ncbi:MAG: HNH endonuclease [Methanosarcinales archaeon]
MDKLRVIDEGGVIDESQENKLDAIIKEQIPSTLSEEERIERANELLKAFKKIEPRNLERGPIGRLLKEKYNFKCQICGFSFRKSDGSYYAEAYHLDSLADGGKDIEENIVILCANHHRMFHYADAEKIIHDREKLVVKLNGEEINIKFNISKEIQ